MITFFEFLLKQTASQSAVGWISYASDGHHQHSTLLNPIFNFICVFTRVFISHSISFHIAISSSWYSFLRLRCRHHHQHHRLRATLKSFRNELCKKYTCCFVIWLPFAFTAIILLLRHSLHCLPDGVAESAAHCTLRSDCSNTGRYVMRSIWDEGDTNCWNLNEIRWSIRRRRREWIRIKVHQVK